MMRTTRIVVAVVTVVAMLAGTARADEQADYEARLQAGREAAYRKYLLRPLSEPETVSPVSGRRLTGVTASGSANTASGGAATLSVLGGTAWTNDNISWTGGASLLSSPPPPQTAFGSQGVGYYERLAALRSGRATPTVADLITHPNYDPRYRRSWPRPLVTREWVPAAWSWDGKRYWYVPGHVKRELHWVIQGRERWHFNGSHYSVTSSTRR